jgi:predicted nucleotidyltransferase
MSKVEEIERAVDQLPPKDFSKLVAWIDRKRQNQTTRDHSAFLNSYAPEDEGLYDDAVAR